MSYDAYQNQARFLELELRIPKQIKEGGSDAAAIEALEKAASSSKAVLIGNFILNLALSASLNQLWVMINTQ